MGSGNGVRALLTGATGMIGANLARRLLNDGFHVCSAVRPGTNLARLQSIEAHLEILQCDMTDRQAVQSAVDKARPEIVFHLASTPFNPPTISSGAHLQVNVLGTLHLLEALRRFPGARMVFTGSTAVYGSGSLLREDRPLLPSTILGASKACASILVQTFSRLYEMQAVELRLFMPYGPWEHAHRLIPHVILSALAGRDVPLSRGTQQRDFIYVGDVEDALMLAATRPLPSGSVFNVGSGVGTKIKEVAARVLKLMGSPVKLLIGAQPTRPDEIMEMSADITAAREVLGWQPRTPLENGLRKSIDWFTEHRELALKLR